MNGTGVGGDEFSFRVAELTRLVEQNQSIAERCFFYQSFLSGCFGIAQTLMAWRIGICRISL